MVIKPNVTRFVKKAGILLLVMHSFSFAADPQIEVRKSDVEIKRLSRSKRVYLLSDLSDVNPTAGKILLLRLGTDNKMAFRILKIYPSLKELAVRHVRKYAGIKNLAVGEQYSALEKMGEYFPASTPEEFAEDKKDVKEIEEDLDLPPEEENAEVSDGKAGKSNINALPYDSDLDMGSSSAEEDRKYRFEEAPQQDEDDLSSIIAEEIKEFDTDKSWFSTEFLLVKNSADSNGTEIVNYASAGFRLGFTLKSFLFFNSNQTQDSLAVDWGLMFYKVSNFESTTDSYNLMPFIATLRYNVWTSEEFGFFGYFGFLKNFLLSSDTADVETNLASGENRVENAKIRLTSVVPALGVGLFVRLGPKWFLRTNIGIESMGGGLMLRF